MQARLDFYEANPSGTSALLALEETIARSTIDTALAELVRIRASQLNGCAFCLDMHMTEARRLGESGRRLAALAVWREAPFFTARERAALEWTEAVTLVAQTCVPDEIWEAVKPHFSAQEIGDLTLVIVAINGWNRIAVSFRTTPA
jgi:AhpD family alkylhydroperoxidase